MSENSEQQALYREIPLSSPRGSVKARFYEAPEERAGVILVPGIAGDYDTPAKELYSRLGEALLAKKISSLRVKFRNPKNLDESERDVDAGINYFLSRKIKRVALVGHAAGGAVVIRAGAARPKEVISVIALSPQSQGTEPVTRLTQSCSLLLIHGTGDTAIPPANSISIHRMAHEPKELMLLENVSHSLDEGADEIFATIQSWLIEKLIVP